MRLVLRALGYVVSWTSLGVFTGLCVIYAVMEHYNRDLPEVAGLGDYAPATISRVYSNDGTVLDEFANEKRLFTPSDEIPDLVKQAFISAEDKNFYAHAGYDPRALTGAFLEAVLGEGERGASTIPQQVAKNFLLSGEQTVERKIRELLLSVRMVNTLSKDQILGLYLNEIFLGQNSYGVTAAARTFFAKPLEDLTIEEMAYLAAVPKGPSNYHPVRDYDAAVTRRNFVLREMRENGYIDQAEYDLAVAQPLRTVQSGDFESHTADLPPRDYFTDEIRRQLSTQYGEETLFSEGLSVRATIDRKLQDRAQWALRRALENYDRDLGLYYGPIAQVDLEALNDNWSDALASTQLPRDIDGWHAAVVLEAGDEAASLGIENIGEASVSLGSMNWARYRGEDGKRYTAKKTSDMAKRGDVIYVRNEGEGKYSMRQIPKVQGAFSAIDPRNGRVLAIAGGFSYEYSNFNRATQAMRQPGSAFKPFVYAAALDSGYQPNAIIVDAPIKINTPQGLWEPKNAGGAFYGPTPMMTGLEQSRNLMTIRLAQDAGIEVVADYGNRYGVYDNMQPVLANALGSQETTLYRVISAYSTFANGGKRISPTVVDRVQDRTGKTIFVHDRRDCVDCVGTGADAGDAPQILSSFEQVMDPITATQIRIMLQSVVSRGTAKNTVGKLGLPIAGKTGTTNESKDAWFVGFTPKIVAGCYIGYDNPLPLLDGRASGGGLCGPVFVNFIQEALKTYGGFDYEVPDGGYFVKIDRLTGTRLTDDARGENVVNMFFRNSTVPDVGTGGAFIDGGFAMGQDVPLIGQDTKVDVEVNVGGQKKALPKNPSIGTISSGGLY